MPKLLEVQRLIGGDASDGKIPTLAEGSCSGCKKESPESMSLIFSAIPFVEHLFSGPACSGARADSERGVKKGDWFAETNAEARKRGSLMLPRPKPRHRRFHAEAS